jgi:predicted RNase H-like HicB family nuclease
MKKYTYKILLKKEPEGGYTVTVPSLPGCLSYGESVEEAVNMAREAIELYIESLVAHNEPVPDESDTIEMEISLDIAV